MKYYLIAGEASGDLHASRLMKALKEIDQSAEFRFIGGDAMAAVGGSPQMHYRDLAFMGFGPVIRHLGTILRGLRHCQHDVLAWKPDVLILVDYPSFNLRVASYVKKHSNIPVYYYIAPKIWAWKEWRIRQIRRDIDELFSILPFEVDFFECKHHYPIHYVGNPTKDEVEEFTEKNGAVESDASTLALLPGSRKQEVIGNLPIMLRAASHFPHLRLTIAGAPGLDSAFYQQFLEHTTQPVDLVFGKTYELLRKSAAALVTSGTATLETALLGVPQVVCYYTSMGKLISWLRKHLLHVRYISLVNLIAQREVVPELVADEMSEQNVVNELKKILPPDGLGRQEMLEGYAAVNQRLGSAGAPQRAASIMVDLLTK